MRLAGKILTKTVGISAFTAIIQLISQGEGEIIRHADKVIDLPHCVVCARAAWKTEFESVSITAVIPGR